MMSPLAGVLYLLHSFHFHLARQKRQLRSIRVLSDTELRRQFARRNFFTLRTTFGANACRPGLVWRALDAYDYVCVTEKR